MKNRKISGENSWDMKKLPDVLERKIEENGYTISYEIDPNKIDPENETQIITFGKYSSGGRDFEFSAEIGENIETFVEGILSTYSDFDVSYETYIWLDDAGHGKNGCPWDMKDAYEDTEECQEFIYNLWNIAREYQIQTQN